MDPGVYMRIDGAMADLLMEIDYDMYHPHMVKEKGKPVIYVELLKALYGTLRAACLFWETLSGKLQEWGFTINPYDSCVANKEVDGQQCTITWHVDDLKISHVDEHVVRSIIQKIQDNFGQHLELSMHIGKWHDYHIQVILQDTPANLRGTSMVPAAKHLFTTRPDALKLSPRTRAFSSSYHATDVSQSTWQTRHLNRHSIPQFMCIKPQSRRLHEIGQGD